MRARSRCLLGLCFLLAFDFQVALAGDLETLRQKAEQGDINAQCKLGVMYYNGEGVPQDYREATYWYRKAARKGDPGAQYMLGISSTGRQAARWLRRAAAQKLPPAEAVLANRYEEGLGVRQSYAKAVALYRDAASRGWNDANFNLGVLYQQGLGVRRDDDLALTYFEKATQQGRDDSVFARGFYFLGDMYGHGRGVNKNLVLSYAYFDIAASHAFSPEETRFYTDLRDKLQLAGAQLEEAQRIAAQWKPGTLIPLKSTN